MVSANSSLHLGATLESIQLAQETLGVTFPPALIEIWKVSNGLELPGGWRLYSVYDPKNPKKTWDDISSANKQGRWDYMPEHLISIAHGDTGNALVLKKESGALGVEIFLWNHETNKIRPWSRNWEHLLALANKRIATISKAINKSKRSSA